MISKTKKNRWKNGVELTLKLNYSLALVVKCLVK